MDIEKTRDRTPSELGAILQYIRLTKGLTTEELSKITRIPQKDIEEIDTGKKIPDVAEFIHLCVALGIQNHEDVLFTIKDSPMDKEHIIKESQKAIL